MQQITVLHDITRRYRINISRQMIGIFLLYSLLIDSCYARGPHHPKSEKRRAEEQKHINEHLFDTKHIQEDLSAQELPIKKKVEEMTEEERNYMYFKVHDLDGNDKLDGLEIFYSATHHSASDHNHEHTETSEKTEVTETTENDSQTSSNDNSSNSDVSNIKLLELNENGKIVNKNINHIIDVLDNFLNLADLDNDGYLNYAEYAAAVKLGKATEEQHFEL